MMMMMMVVVVVEVVVVLVMMMTVTTTTTTTLMTHHGLMLIGKVKISRGVARDRRRPRQQPPRQPHHTLGADKPRATCYNSHGQRPLSGGGDGWWVKPVGAHTDNAGYTFPHLCLLATWHQALTSGPAVGPPAFVGPSGPDNPEAGGERREGEDLQDEQIHRQWPPGREERAAHL
jgi:hypothetical protein